MKKLLTIIPSRGRNENLKAYAKNFFEKSRISELLVGLDDDDAHNYDRLPNIHYDINPRLRLVGTTNLLANKYCNQYEYLGFMGDDHRPRTDGWDELLIDSIKHLEFGIAYGQDLAKGSKLPTAVIVNSEIVRRVGYMGPPTLVHLWMDNFWLELGKALKSIIYNPNIIIEHMHHIRRKAPKDLTYQEANSFKARDRKNWSIYMRDQFHLDVAKFK